MLMNIGLKCEVEKSTGAGLAVKNLRGAKVEGFKISELSRRHPPAGNPKEDKQ